MELTTQCQLALGAVGALNGALQRMNERQTAARIRREAMRSALEEGRHEDFAALASEEDADSPLALQVLTQDTFRSIHSFLTHASNASKLLWPGVPMRKPDESRNTYIERLSSEGPKKKRVATVRAAERGIFLRELLHVTDEDHPLRYRTLRDHLEHFDERIDDWAANGSDHNYVQDFIGPYDQVVGAADSDRMRSFDPYTLHFTFRGEIYDLQPIATAIADLLRDATDAANQSFRRGSQCRPDQT